MRSRLDFSPPPPIELRPARRNAAPQPAEPTAPALAPRKAISLRKRIAALLAVIGVPAMASTGDFGALPGDAPAEHVAAEVSAGAAGALEFEQPGMSFPGSAFYYLADPPVEALVALPETDPLARGAAGGREVGALIDAGPAAAPFLAASGTGLARAQDCLAQAVYYEAASESEAGQRAVAQVVLNRVAHPAWPSSVCGVVYQGSERPTGCQFTFTCDGSLARRAGGVSWAHARRIAAAALAGEVYAPIGHATHYHTLWVSPYWATSLDHVGTIGAHRFYRNRGAAGEKAAFSAAYAGAEPVVSVPRPASTQIGADSATSAEAPSTTAPRIRAVLPEFAGPSTPLPPVTQSAPPKPADERLADPAMRSAGQAREEFARAGRWKVDPASIGASPAPAQQANEANRPAQ
jgi:hypothetical protein